MAELLRAVENYLRKTGMPETHFGRKAVNDPRLVWGLRNGREPRPRTAERVRAYMAATAELYKRRCQLSPSVWTPDMDAHLWAMVSQGISRKDIAYSLEVSTSSVEMRIKRLADQLFPDRPLYARLSDLIREAGGLAACSPAPSL